MEGRQTKEFIRDASYLVGSEARRSLGNLQAQSHRLLLGNFRCLGKHHRKQLHHRRTSFHRGRPRGYGRVYRSRVRIPMGFGVAQTLVSPSCCIPRFHRCPLGIRVACGVRDYCREE